MTNLIRSMTASARCFDQGDWGDATWEIRSVNHRYLDAHIHLPGFLSSLEVDAREIIRKNLQRGRIDCYLKYQPSAIAKLQLTIDENLVEQLVNSTNVIKAKLGNFAAIDPISILSWPNVIRQEEASVELARAAVLALLQHTVGELVLVREREGQALKEVMERMLLLIKKEIVKIKQYLPEILNSTKRRISEKFREMKLELDSVRLEQEMILFVHKADITEELDRLAIHLQEFHRILEFDNGVGKRLDFLTQELNREANTLASKSIDVKVTQAAVEIKVLIEQIREQVQNLE
jgi:uncharacterized protein (TIGR00255 family)